MACNFVIQWNILQHCLAESTHPPKQKTLNNEQSCVKSLHISWKCVQSYLKHVYKTESYYSHQCQHKRLWSNCQIPNVFKRGWEAKRFIWWGAEHYIFLSFITVHTKALPGSFEVLGWMSRGFVTKVYLLWSDSVVHLSPFLLGLVLLSHRENSSENQNTSLPDCLAGGRKVNTGKRLGELLRSNLWAHLSAGQSRAPTMREWGGGCLPLTRHELPQ